jgi:hypothetical protein
LRRFRSTDYYLRTDFGPGDLYKNDDDEAVRGYAFKGSSRKVEWYFKFGAIQNGAILMVHTYLVGS